MKVFIGYDPRDHDAYTVLEHSIRENTACAVDIVPIKEWELRQKELFWRSWRMDAQGQMWDDRDGRPFSTQFSFTRFAVPLLQGHTSEWVLFLDADMMFRDDIKELFALADDKYDVMCVQHDHQPNEALKMDGMIQSAYRRKNWSSVMLIRPSRCRVLDKYALNNWSGSDLHGMKWAEKIGKLPKVWNFLAGYDDPSMVPKNVHFTLGTPDMQNMNAPRTPYDAEWWDVLDRAKKGICNAPPS